MIEKIQIERLKLVQNYNAKLDKSCTQSNYPGELIECVGHIKIKVITLLAVKTPAARTIIMPVRELLVLIAYTSSEGWAGLHKVQTP